VRVEPEQRTIATFLLAVDEHGGVLGFRFHREVDARR
jgi:hypothetical protein